MDIQCIWGMFFLNMPFFILHRFEVPILYTHTTLLTLALSSTFSLAGLSDFYVSSTRGNIFSVNGETLEATPLGTVPGVTGGAADLEYMGNGQLFYNSIRNVYRYNTITGEHSTEIDISTFGSDAFGARGLSKTVDGRLHFQRQIFVPGQGVLGVGTAYDIADSSYETATPSITSFRDYEILNDSQVMILDQFGITVSIEDTNTGETLNEISLDVNPEFLTSILRMDDSLYLMSHYGELYSFDLESESISFAGQISGIGNSYMQGATVPTPSSIAPLALTLFAIRRRRRS